MKLLKNILLILCGAMLSCTNETDDHKCGESVILENRCDCQAGIGHSEVIEMAAEGCGYHFLINNIDFIALYINKIRNGYSVEEMKKLASIVKEKNIPVMVELGGVLGPGWGNLTDVNNGKESALIADFPYNYATGKRASPIQGNNPKAIDWIARIRELEDYVRGLGLEFLLYTNTEEMVSDSVYCAGTLQYVDLYRERGGAPDRWLVQSWYPVPTSFGPEDQQNAMAWLVNEVNNKLNLQ